MHFNGNREKVREQTVVQALDLLRRSVLSHYKNGLNGSKSRAL